MKNHFPLNQADPKICSMKMLVLFGNFKMNNPNSNFHRTFQIIPGHLLKIIQTIIFLSRANLF